MKKRTRQCIHICACAYDINKFTVKFLNFADVPLFQGLELIRLKCGQQTPEEL